jgi:energy-coupling factor transport system ATP-binding protein
VEDEIAFGPENMGKDIRAISEVVERSLEYANLKAFRHNLVWELSGGQAQRLGIGCILAMQTPIIILDEPTANLDPIATRYIHALAMKLKTEGITIILVTKESDEFLEQADEIFVLNEGRLFCSGKPRAVINRYGDDLADKLGIWLPEVCEIGLGLRKLERLDDQNIPLTVDEAIEAIDKARIEFAMDARQQDPAHISALLDIEKPVLISATDVEFAYPGERQAVKGITFEVRRGEMLAIVGRNGAGKSTLSKLLVGLLKPRAGKLILFEKKATLWNVADLSRKIALVFQNPEHQFLTDTVFAEIAYSFLSKSGGNIPPDELKESVERVLQMLDLQDVADDHPFSLSAGCKRRLGVAAMLVGSPEVLVVDEPTYGQDKAMTGGLMKLISQLRQTGITIIMITHSMRLVQEYAERVIVMNEGLIMFDGNPGELFGHADILEQASLAVTSLQTLVEKLRARGKIVPAGVKSVSDFLKKVQTLNL